MISIAEAFDLITRTVQAGSVQAGSADQVDAIEEVDLGAAVDRVLAYDVTADVDSPPHDKSLMDGFAVRSDDINAGHRELEITETIAAGQLPGSTLRPGQAARIMTGAPLPRGADAVVMIELAQFDDVRVTVEIDRIQTGKHIARLGDNFRQGAIVFSRGHRVRPTDIGLLAEVGAHRLRVFRRTTIVVLPTGDELVECDQIPQPAQIRNSNGPLLQAMASRCGMSVTRLPIARDNRVELESLIRQGLQHEILLLTGGVSAGLFDLVPQILKEQGVQQIFHQVAIKPGKPIWFGCLDRTGRTKVANESSERGVRPRRTYVFGLPGNPVSSLVGFHLFVGTTIRMLEGVFDPAPRSESVCLARDHQTRGNRPTYWPASPALPRSSDRSSERWFEPLDWKGSSDLMTLGRATGFLYFPADRSEFQAGEVVQYFPLG